MKPANEDVFFLIRSMTPAEKKHFRQYARRHVIGEQNNYLALFEEIEKQNAYDEERLKEIFGHTRFAAYFPVAKRYLYDQIIESLHYFHTESSPEEQIKKDLHGAEILLEKGLPQQAWKLLKKNRTRINRYELFHLLPAQLKLERKCMDRTLYEHTGEETLENWRRDFADCLEMLREESEYGFLNSSISRRHYRKISSPNLRKQSEADVPDIEFMVEENRRPKGLRAQMDYYKAMATHRFMKGDPAGAYRFNQAFINLFEDHPHLMELFPKQYLGALNNFLIDNHQLKKYDALEEGIRKLEQLSERKEFQKIPQIKEKIFERSSLLKLNALIDQDRFADALALLPGILERLQQYRSRISVHNLYTFYYLAAYIYFDNQRFDEAQTWLNKMLHGSRKKIVEELFRFANLLHLLIHFELGNFDLLDHLINSVRRQHSQQGGLYQAEVLLFRYLRRLANASDSRERKELFAELKKELGGVSAGKEEQRAFIYFNYFRWLEVKAGL
jgi:hypothetical protein